MKLSSENDTRTNAAWVMGSQTLFSGMLMNLIDNALRYTPEQGKVTVSVDLGEDGWIIVTVADNGPGIPAEARERVFERFYRNAAPDQHGAGLGLGLAIVKEIVQAAQGTIALSGSAGGKGLTVTVRLPSGSQ